jgi:hypothetical protein
MLVFALHLMQYVILFFVTVGSIVGATQISDHQWKWSLCHHERR